MGVGGRGGARSREIINTMLPRWHRNLLAEQKCRRKPSWRDENKREATRTATVGGVAKNWLGDPDESEWEDPDGEIWLAGDVFR